MKREKSYPYFDEDFKNLAKKEQMGFREQTARELEEEMKEKKRRFKEDFY